MSRNSDSSSMSPAWSTSAVRRRPRRTAPAAPGSARSRSRGPCPRRCPRDSPSSRAAPSGSVTMSAQSVARMSAARASPRRVGFTPTTRGAGERGAVQPEQVLGPVGEEHADVQGRRRPSSERASAPRVAPSCIAWRQVQLPPASITPVRSSSARAASMAATVVTTSPLRSPIPAPDAPGCGPARRRSPRRTAPWPAAALPRTSAATRPRPPRHRRPAPTDQSGSRAGRPVGCDWRAGADSI